jgi:hypothetical protein
MEYWLALAKLGSIVIVGAFVFAVSVMGEDVCPTPASAIRIT